MLTLYFLILGWILLLDLSSSFYISIDDKFAIFNNKILNAYLKNSSGTMYINKLACCSLNHARYQHERNRLYKLVLRTLHISLRNKKPFAQNMIRTVQILHYIDKFQFLRTKKDSKHTPINLIDDWSIQQYLFINVILLILFCYQNIIHKFIPYLISYDVWVDGIDTTTVRCCDKLVRLVSKLWTFLSSG